MAGVLLPLVMLLAGLAWLSIVVHGLLLLPHRRDDISIFQLSFQGYRFYQGSTWKESGRALHRRFLLSVVTFAGLALLAMITGILIGH